MDSLPYPEPILEPDLPIIDAHHHLWFLPESMLTGLDRAQTLAAKTMAPTFRRHSRYLFDEHLANLNSGHNVRATIFIEANSMYRIDGPEAMRTVGEIEFANGIAAMAASGVLTDIKMCAGIVGSVDLRLGDAAEDVLLAQIQAGGSRYRGIRAKHVAYDDDPRIMGAAGGTPQLLLDKTFRAGFRHLAKLGLSYDAWQLEYQLPDLIDLAQAFPDTQIIVNHVGGLFGLGPYADRKAERFSAWRKNILALAALPNVAMKLGGLGMPTAGLRSAANATHLGLTPLSSEELADDWRPYIETCIEAFGASRCMFESNFPVDAGAASYSVLWNSFKRIASGASADEKAALFSATAARIYKISI